MSVIPVRRALTVLTVTDLYQEGIPRKQARTPVTIPMGWAVRTKLTAPNVSSMASGPEVGPEVVETCSPQEPPFGFGAYAARMCVVCIVLRIIIFQATSVHTCQIFWVCH